MNPFYRVRMQFLLAIKLYLFHSCLQCIQPCSHSDDFQQDQHTWLHSGMDQVHNRLCLKLGKRKTYRWQLNFLSFVLCASRVQTSVWLGETIKKYKVWNLLVSQLLPVYPALQSQRWLPTRSTHVAPFWHGSGAQSFMSEIRKKENVSLTVKLFVLRSMC